MHSYKVKYEYVSFLHFRENVIPELTKFIEQLLEEEKNRKINIIELKIRNCINSLLPVHWSTYSFIDVWPGFRGRNYFGVHIFIPRSLNILLRAVCIEVPSLTKLGVVAAAKAVKRTVNASDPRLNADRRMMEEKILSELEIPQTLVMEIRKCIQTREDPQYPQYF